MPTLCQCNTGNDNLIDNALYVRYQIQSPQKLNKRKPLKHCAFFYHTYMLTLGK